MRYAEKCGKRFLAAAAAALSLGCGGGDANQKVGKDAVDPETDALLVAAGKSVSGGHSHSCVLLAGGAVHCFGDNVYGQLGRRAESHDASSAVAPSTAVDLGTKRTAKVLVSGSHHNCAILDNDQLKCWGYNADGQLGLEDSANRGVDSALGDALPPVNLGTGRTAKALALGETHTCAIVDTDRVKCWGSAYEGALGYGDDLDRGAVPGTMGDDLPAVDLGTGRTAKAIAVTSYRTTCAILDDDKVKCWGINQGCGLGNGNGDVLSYGFGHGTMGDQLPYVDIGVGRTALAIAADGYTVCVLRDNGTVKCWGNNSNGQVGIDSTAWSIGCSAAEVGDAGIVSMGAGDVTAIDVGAAHACALRSNGEVKCWGHNGSGQLGVGNTTELRVPSAALSLGSGFVPRAIALGGYHTCAISNQNRVKCWGEGSTGQLMNGFFSDVGSEPGQMGSVLPYSRLGS
jgi:alpha-tubulin suppressor-like RCC1 family protein